MKKLIAYILLTGIILPGLLIFSFLNVEKQNLKEKNRGKSYTDISNKEMIIVQFSLHEVNKCIEWENDHEFEWNGNMYDVVRKEVKLDSIFYWCHLDKEETIINECLDELNRFLAGAESNTEEKQQILNKLFKKLYCADANEWTVYTELEIVSRFISHLTPLNKSEIKVPTPPPDDRLSV